MSHILALTPYFLLLQISSPGERRPSYINELCKLGWGIKNQINNPVKSLAFCQTSLLLFLPLSLFAAGNQSIQSRRRNIRQVSGKPCHWKAPRVARLQGPKGGDHKSLIIAIFVFWTDQWSSIHQSLMLYRQCSAKILPNSNAPIMHSTHLPFVKSYSSSPP